MIKNLRLKRKETHLLVECVEEESDVVRELGADAFGRRIWGSTESGVGRRRIESLRVREA